MTLQTDLQAAVDKASTASDKLHAIVNGDSISTVTTDNGEVKTLAKAVADNEAALATSIADVTTKRDEAEAFATTAASHEANSLANANAAAASAAEGLYSNVISKAFVDTPILPLLSEEGTLFRIDTSAGNVIVNLSDLVTYAEDMKYAFVKVTPDTNTITINCGGTDTINGTNSTIIANQYEVNVLVGDSTTGAWIKAVQNITLADGSLGFEKLSVDALATQAEAEAGVATNKLLTPERVKQAIAVLQTALSSQAEAEAGIENTKYMSALRVKQAIDALAGGGSGKVLQIVSATDSGPVQVTTTALVNTGLTATITPSSSSSKILIFANLQGVSANTNGAGMFALIRGSTNIHTLAEAIGYTATTTSNFVSTVSCSKEDFPNTTTAVTYKIQAAAKLGSLTIHNYYSTSSNVNSSIILMEIGA